MGERFDADEQTAAVEVLSADELAAFDAAEAGGAVTVDEVVAATGIDRVLVRGHVGARTNARRRASGAWTIDVADGWVRAALAHRAKLNADGG